MESNPPSAPTGPTSNDPPAQTNADGLVARVNMDPEAASEQDVARPAPTLPGSWSIQAIVLGVVALGICVLALILILPGIFEVTPK